MTNLLRFVGIMFLECSAALMSGKNVFGVLRRARDIFYIKPKDHDSLTELEREYAVLFILIMANGNPQFSLDIIRQEMGMDEEEFEKIIDDCVYLGLIFGDRNDGMKMFSSYSFDRVYDHFRELRQIYIHDGDHRKDVVSGIYRLLEKVYHITRCNPAWTFISLRPDEEFRTKIQSKVFETTGAKGFHTHLVGEAAQRSQ